MQRNKNAQFNVLQTEGHVNHPGSHSYEQICTGHKVTSRPEPLFFFFFSFRIPSYSNRRFQIIVYEVRSMYAVCLPSRSPTEDSVCTRTRTRNLCNYWYIQKGAFILFSASMAIVDNLFFVLSSMFRSIYQSAMNRT